MTTVRRIDPLDPADEDLFLGAVEVYAGAQRAIWGPRGSAWSANEIRAFHELTTTRRVAWVAVADDGSVCGAVELIETLRDNHSSATIWLAVHPDARGRGIGAELLLTAEDQARTDGRTIFFAESEWPEGATDSAERFARQHGYRPALTDIRRGLQLPVDPARMRDLRDHAGRTPGDYAIEIAWDGLPEDWLADRAVLQRRMSTDIPMGHLFLEEQDWDADRVREDFALRVAQGRRVIEAVARHLPSGRLVGFSDVNLPAEPPDLAYQGDTLVMREHRGNKLGLRLKAALALELMERAPQIRQWRTWNAADNEPMIAVNVELGYVVEGYLREWQKRLP